MDAASCASAGKAIFSDRIYEFTAPTDSRQIRILDCGANIGLGVLFWLNHFPSVSITAFEPDPTVFACLKRNVETWNQPAVNLVNAAVGKQSGTLLFQPDGADSGRLVADEATSTKCVEVPVVRLTDYLDQPIDLLKIDIEGAEADLLTDIKDHLHLVERVFVELHSFVAHRQRFDEVLSVLRLAGFRTYLQPEYCVAHPFLQESTPHSMDNRINVFAVRTGK